MRALRLAVVLGVVGVAGGASAADYCGGVWHQNTCGRPTNIYPCCYNGANCTWWAWEMMCRNWGIGPNNWGNANTWGGNARLDPRFELTSAVAGAVATSTAGDYGHVAWTTSAGGGRVSVTDQNCCSTCAGSVLSRSFSASFFNSGYVVPRGSLCACSPGQVESKPCGDCGTTRRTCGSNCQWGGWSGCAGADPEGGNKACANGKLGVCADARLRCESGTLACRQLVQPAAERCDGLDNDCDGEVDEGNPTEGASERDYAATRVDGSWPRAAPAGSRVTAWVEFANAGKKRWSKGDVWLAAPVGEGASVFASDSWPAWDLAAGLATPIGPGEVARFSVELTVPPTPGARLEETFHVEAPGRTPVVCPDGEFRVSLLVLNADGSTPSGVSEAEAQEAGVRLQGEGCSTTGGAPLWPLLALALALALRQRRGLWPALTALVGFAACTGDATIVSSNAPMSVFSITPDTVSARGGDQVTLRGEGFREEDVEVAISGRRLRATYVSAGELRLRTPPLVAGQHTLVLSPDTVFRREFTDALSVEPLTLRFVEAPPHVLTQGAGTVDSAQLVDFDNDGHADLITCGSRCEVLFNDGRGNFLAPQLADAGVGDGGVRAALPAGTLAAVADLDGDGWPDVVLKEGSVGRVYRNEGGVPGGAPVLELPGLEALTLASLDDGPVRLLVAAGGRLTSHLVYGNARGLRLDVATLHDGGIADGGAAEGEGEGADEAPWWPIPAARALLTGDFDGDGRTDVVVSTASAPNGVALRLFLNRAGGLEEVPGGLPGGPLKVARWLAAADVDGDGDLDLLAVGDGQDRLLLNDGSAHFFDGTVALFPVDDSVGTSLSMVDLNRDGRLDAVVGNDGATPRLYVNDGRGRFFDKTPLLPVTSRTLAAVLTADVDDDGDDDVVFIGRGPDDTRVYLSVEPRP